VEIVKDPSHPHAGSGGVIPPVETRFTKGGPGGPGRPKGASVKAAVLRRLAANPNEHGEGAEAARYADEFLRSVLAGDEESTRVANNISKLIEHVDGKPRQTIEHEGTPISISVNGGVVEPPELPASEPGAAP
jgi:hypothetical protein